MWLNLRATVGGQVTRSSSITRARGCGAHRAFTLIEIIIVVVIIGIAAGIVVPMMSSAGTMQVRAAANIVAADLEYAKSMAISHGQTYSVVFNVGAESYQIVDQTGAVITHPVKKQDYVVDFANDGRLDRVDIVSANFDATAKVTFDYLGAPYNGGSPAGPLMDPDRDGGVRLRAGGVEKIVTVEPVTGFISVKTISD